MRTTFVMEQHLGHQSYYRNLRGCIESDPRIKATWVEITYQTAGAIWQRMPGLPAGLKGSLAGRTQARHGLRSAPADVLFFNTQVPAALAGRDAIRQPYVLSTDITPIQYDRMAAAYGHTPDADNWLGRYKRRANRRLFQAASRVVAWSNWTRQSLIDDYGVRAERLAVIPPGIDLAKWHVAPRQAGGPLRILFVGGDWVRKGGEDLIRAFRTLPAGEAELVLVTRAPIAPAEGIQVYRELQPNSPELIALGRTCDVFALPTRAEAFGIAALEAGCLGLPVVASAVGGLTDIVVHGETGFLVKAGDWLELAHYLRCLLDDGVLRARLGRAASDRVQARFDVRQNADRLVALLCEVGAATMSRFDEVMR